MDKQFVIGRLMALPQEIFATENELITISEKIQDAKNTLTAREAELLTSGMIDGKNAEQRAAQLKQLTELERATMANTEKQLPAIRAALTRLQNEFSALKAVAGMMREVA